MSTATMPAEATWLKANVTEKPIGVDREAGEAGVIFGFVVAEEGPFKSEGRGEFNLKGLKAIVKLMKANGKNGTKSRFTHPDMSNDGLGKFLGRGRLPRIASIERDDETVQLVRADLHIDPTAMEEPVGGGRPLGDYVMALAERDPDALSSSLVLNVDEETRMERGRPAMDEDGNTLPPLWFPTAIHATDIVDTGDAVGALLSGAGPANAILLKAAELLDTQFAGCPREVVEARVLSYLGRYLNRRYGELPQSGLDIGGSAFVPVGDSPWVISSMECPDDKPVAPLHPKTLRMIKKKPE